MTEPDYHSPRCRHRCILWALIGLAIGFTVFALTGCATVPAGAQRLTTGPLVILQRFCGRDLRLIAVARDGRRIYVPPGSVPQNQPDRDFLNEVLADLKAEGRPVMVDDLDQAAGYRCPRQA